MIHRLAYDEYAARPGIRQSNLKRLAKSPAHYQEALRNPVDTASLAIGRAAHVAILEPHLFADEFVVAPKLDRRTSAGKAAWAELEASGKTILSAEDGKTVEAMKAAVMAHESARKLIELCHTFEGSIFWTDKESGVECKARLDGINYAVIDLKSTKDASPAEFSRSLFSYGYHLQAAHTLNGCAALGLGLDAFIFIAAEKEPPYGVAVYQIDELSLSIGAQKVQELLHLYKRCEESGQWPCYPDKIQKIALPAWVTKKYEGDW